MPQLDLLNTWFVFLTVFKVVKSVDAFHYHVSLYVVLKLTVVFSIHQGSPNFLPVGQGFPCNWSSWLRIWEQLPHGCASLDRDWARSGFIFFENQSMLSKTPWVMVLREALLRYLEWWATYLERRKGRVVSKIKNNQGLPVYFATLCLLSFCCSNQRLVSR